MSEEDREWAIRIRAFQGYPPVYYFRQTAAEILARLAINLPDETLFEFTISRGDFGGARNRHAAALALADMTAAAFERDLPPGPVASLARPPGPSWWPHPGAVPGPGDHPLLSVLTPAEKRRLWPALFPPLPEVYECSQCGAGHDRWDREKCPACQTAEPYDDH